jgi:beta-lactamase class D
MRGVIRQIEYDNLVDISGNSNDDVWIAAALAIAVSADVPVAIQPKGARIDKFVST